MTYRKLTAREMQDFARFSDVVRVAPIVRECYGNDAATLVIISHSNYNDEYFAINYDHYVFDARGNAMDYIKHLDTSDILKMIGIHDLSNLDYITDDPPPVRILMNLNNADAIELYVKENDE